jgi:helicase SWR1
MGMMGFLAPKDLKKLKEAAKSVVDERNAETALPATNGTNGANGTNGHDYDDVLSADEHAQTNGDHQLFNVPAKSLQSP